MNPISQMLISQAESIQGYSPDILLADLLASRIRLVRYSEAAKAVGVKRGTVVQWTERGMVTRYGPKGAGRVNLNEIISRFMTTENDKKSQLQEVTK